MKKKKKKTKSNPTTNSWAQGSIKLATGPAAENKGIRSGWDLSSKTFHLLIYSVLLTLCTLPAPVSLGDSCCWTMPVELTLSVK